MKLLLFLISVMACLQLQAQSVVGIYEYENDKGYTYSLQLKDDNTFSYLKETKWNQVRMEGTWVQEAQQVLLTTNEQLSNYRIEGLNDGTLPKGELKLEIRAESAKKGPKKINSLYALNGSDTLCQCEMSYHDAMEAQKRLAKMAAEGGAYTRDSLSKLYIPRFYRCETDKKIQSLLLSFDNAELKIDLSQQSDNYLIMHTRFAKNDQYEYMLNEPFRIERKALLAENKRVGRKQKPAKYKKQKR